MVKKGKKMKNLCILVLSYLKHVISAIPLFPKRESLKSDMAEQSYWKAFKITLFSLDDTFMLDTKTQG